MMPSWYPNTVQISRECKIFDLQSCEAAHLWFGFEYGLDGMGWIYCGSHTLSTHRQGGPLTSISPQKYHYRKQATKSNLKLYFNTSFNMRRKCSFIYFTCCSNKRILEPMVRGLFSLFQWRKSWGTLFSRGKVFWVSGQWTSLRSLSDFLVPSSNATTMFCFSL